MGPGVPYAIAAKFAHPDRPVDRARRRRRDADERPQRADHGREVLRRAGATRGSSCSCSTTAISTRSRGSSARCRATRCTPATQQIPDFPYARFAELIGLGGIRVDDPEQIGDAWDQALAARPSGRPRGDRRSRCAAASAAHQLRAGEALRAGRDRRPATHPDRASVVPANGRSDPAPPVTDTASAAEGRLNVASSVDVGALLNELRRTVNGEVRFRPGDRALYAAPARTTASCRSASSSREPSTTWSRRSRLPRARRADPLARRRHEPRRPVLQRRRRARLLEVPEPDPRDRPRAASSRASSRASSSTTSARRRRSTASRSGPIRRRTTTARSAG